MRKETYCLSCRRYTKNINPRIVKNKQDRSMIQSNCTMCGSKKSRFNLGIRTPLNKVPLLNILL